MPKLDPADIGRPLSVGAVAERAGVTVSALHFYEARGLIHSVRNEGNQRRYARDVLRRVAVIKVAQRIGISLEDIGTALASLPEGRTPNVQDWARLSKGWQKELDARIAQLQALRDQLGDCIGCGCLSLGACKLRNPLDTLSEEGPGPRRIVTE